MKSDNIFIAFSSVKTTKSVSDIIRSSGMNVVCTVTSLASLRKYIFAYGGGIIVCGCKFNDDSVFNLLDELPPDISVMLIGTPSQLAQFDNDTTFKLSVPLRKTELVYSLYMLMSQDTQAVNHRSTDEDKLIAKAKLLLVERYAMTEDEAHRYMQKKSMDNGIKMTEVAKIILKQ